MKKEVCNMKNKKQVSEYVALAKLTRTIACKEFEDEHLHPDIWMGIFTEICADKRHDKIPEKELKEWLLKHEYSKNKSKTMHEQLEHDEPMTDAQKKAIFVITHKNVNGEWEQNELYAYLPEKWEKWNKHEASKFIDKYGKKGGT
jgi:hypothetical protein